jgi:alkyl sulfatase BDS1-like metallo-beta-lactamase superfamily hydrolase
MSRQGSNAELRQRTRLYAAGSLTLLALGTPATAHDASPRYEDAMTEAAAEREAAGTLGRRLLAREYPAALRNLMRNDGFGGPSAPAISNRMQDRAPELVAEARSKMSVVPFGTQEGRGLWHIRFPYVNVTLVETPRGLVLLDSGYAAIGPVLRDLIPTLSPKPLLAIAISHSHVDHAYGAYALLEKWPDADVITTEAYLDEVASDIRLRGSIAKYNNQTLAAQPTKPDDLAIPTITFRDRLEKDIGGETFVFIHAPGETIGQHYVWMPERKALATGDYYQGFLPNAGNGKRQQRYVEEWIAAFRDMAARSPELMLPMHGAPIRGEVAIGEALTGTADAFEHVERQAIDGLNRGLRKDQIAAAIDWPDRFARNPLLDPQYNRPADIARMVMKRWTGWWDDIPSHFAPLAFEAEAREAVALAGGIAALDRRARALLPDQPMLAARLADWAYYGAPGDPAAKRLFVDVYMTRIGDPATPLQEGVTYLAAAAQARAELETLNGTAGAR